MPDNRWDVVPRYTGPMAELARHRLSYAEYLDAEQALGQKCEYVDGEIFAMAGGTPTHSLLGASLGGVLFGALPPGPCRAYNSELKIHIPERNASRYADVSVICGPIERAEVDANAVTNPTVVIEVLSRGTSDVDRSDKLDEYRTLPTLQHYVMVWPDQLRIDVYHRSRDGAWRYEVLGAADLLRLDAVGVELPVERIYAGVELDPPLRRPRALEA